MERDICGDNRFEIIKKAKEDLFKTTNIQMAKDEMACLNDFLHRCWQMGWLDKYDESKKEILDVEKYRQRMIQAFINAECSEFIALVALPTEKDFQHLEWLLETHYKKK